MKIWYVEHPLYQYNEDVKAIAAKAGLKIIDAQFDDGKGVKDAPKLTKKGDKKADEPKAPKKADEPKAE